MAHFTSIQEMPSYEGSEVTSSKLRLNQSFEHDHSHQRPDPKSPLSAGSNKSSPELKRCSVLCPRNRADLYHFESQLFSVLKKTERNINEAILIYKHVKNFTFFKQFKEKNKHLHTTDALIHLCKIVKYETFHPGAVIYRKEDQPDKKVYIVFTGAVEFGDKKLSGPIPLVDMPQKVLKKDKHARTMINICSEEKPTSAPEKAAPKRLRTFRRGNRDLSESIKASAEAQTQGTGLERKNASGMNSYRSKQGSEGPKRTNTKKDIPTFGMIGSEGLDGSTVRSGNNDKIDSRLLEGGSLKLEIDGPTSLKRIHEAGSGHDESAGSDSDKKQGEKIGALLGVSKPILKKGNSRGDGKFEEEGKPEDKGVKFVRRLTKSHTTASLIHNGLFQKIETPGDSEKSGQKSILRSPKGILKNSLKLGSDSQQTQELISDGISSISQRENPTQLITLAPSQTLASQKTKEGDLASSDLDISVSTNSIEDFMDEDLEALLKDSVTVKKGSTFGESVLESNNPRAETVVAATMVGAITFTTNDYDYITTRFEKTNTKRLNFLLDHVPELEKAIKYEKLKDVDTFFHEKTFNLHSQITCEGEKGKFVYLLYEGLCKVYKESFCISRRPDGADKNPICIIQKGVFIGEEILFSGTKHYGYTVKAASATVVVMAIKKEIFKTVMPFEVQHRMKALYANKIEHHQDMLERKLKISNKLTLASSSGGQFLIKQLKGEGLVRKPTLSCSTGSKNNLFFEKENGSLAYNSYREMTRTPEDSQKSARSASEDAEIDRSQQPKKAKKNRKLAEGQQSLMSETHDKTDGRYSVGDQQSSTTDSTVIKEWGQVASGPFIFGPKKLNMKYQGALIQLAEDQKMKMKSEFNKFSRKNALEGVFLSNLSGRSYEETINKPKETSQTTEKILQNTSKLLPKIDSSDIESLKFDFGSRKDARGRREQSETSKDKLVPLQLKNSREGSPKDMGPLVQSKPVKGPAFILNRITVQSKTASGILFSPKTIQKTTSPEKKTINSHRANTAYSVAFRPTNMHVLNTKNHKAKVSGFLPSEMKKIYQIAQSGYSPRKNGSDGLVVEGGVLGPNLSHFATPKHSARAKKAAF